MTARRDHIELVEQVERDEALKAEARNKLAAFSGAAAVEPYHLPHFDHSEAYAAMDETAGLHIVNTHTGHVHAAHAASELPDEPAKRESGPLRWLWWGLAGVGAFALGWHFLSKGIA